MVNTDRNTSGHRNRARDSESDADNNVDAECEAEAAVRLQPTPSNEESKFTIHELYDGEWHEA